MTPARPHARSLRSMASLLWLNLFFWSSVALVTLLFFFVGVPYTLLFLIVAGRRRTKWLIRRTISHYGQAVMKCGWPLVQVRYVDHSPEDRPPFVFVSNHRSASDVFLMGHLPGECIVVLNNWPSKIPILGSIAAIAGYLKVRKMPFDEFLAAGSKLLSEGVSVVCFPEGTRSGSRRLGNFHGSAIRLAQQAGAKIVPLALYGNENIPMRGSLVLHPGRIVLAKLPAMTQAQYQDMSAYQVKVRVRDQIQRELEAEPAATA